MTMARIPLPDVPDSPGLSSVVYATYAPDLGAALLTYKASLRSMQAVDGITKELVRLRNAHIAGCQVCSNFRGPGALEAGFDESLVAEVDDPESERLTASQHAALRLAEAFLLCPFLDDELKAELQRHLTPAQLVEIVLNLVSWGTNKSTVMLGIDYDGDERLEADPRFGTDYALASLLDAARASVDPDLFEPMAVRAAQVLDVPTGLVVDLIGLTPQAVAHRVDQLGIGPGSPALTDRQRVAVAHAVRSIVDRAGTTDTNTNTAQVLDHLTPDELAGFEVAVGVVERALRSVALAAT